MLSHRRARPAFHWKLDPLERRACGGRSRPGSRWRSSRPPTGGGRAQACLERIAALDPRLHAFITVTADEAFAEAKLAEADIAAGNYRGPLHGIPISHKDIVCTQGVRTTANSNLLRDWIPEADATVNTRLKQAGAVSLGKTTLYEFAQGLPGPERAFEPALNPWNTDYSPGGSSSGSGAAVAAGLCFGAIGTDTGGSIRQPAAVCGIVGMKPTYGRVSVHGVLPLAPSLDHVGPMTRTVHDNALMLQVIAGHDPADATSLRDPAPDFQRLMGQDVRGMRIGVPRRFIEAIPHDADCLAAFDEALRVFTGLGLEVQEVDIASLVRAGDLGTRIHLAESFAYHKENLAKHPEKFDVSFRARLANGPHLTEAQLREAQEVREELRSEYRTLFTSDGIDIIASPGRERIADDMAWLLENPVSRSNATRMYNMTGMPCECQAKTGPP